MSSVAYSSFDAARADETISPNPAMAPITLAAYEYDSSNRLLRFTNSLMDDHTEYTYRIIGGNTVLASVSKEGYATEYFDYSTGGGARLTTYSRDGATPAIGRSIQRSFVYDIPMSAPGLPELGAVQISKWGQVREPVSAVAVFNADHPVDTTTGGNFSAANAKYAALHFVDRDGLEVNSATYGSGKWLVTSNEYDADGNYVAHLGAAEIQQALAEVAAGATFVPASKQELTRYNSPVLNPDPELPPLIAANTFVTDTWSAPFWAALSNGTTAWVVTHTQYQYDIGAPNGGINPSTGLPFMLKTRVRAGVASAGSVAVSADLPVLNDLETLSVIDYGYEPLDGSSSLSDTSGWTLGTPTSVTSVMPNSADNVTRSYVFNPNGSIAETWEPMSSGSDAGVSRTISYTADANAADARCGLRPEWAGLACLTSPLVAPASGPDIADSFIASYNMWLSPETVVETSGEGADQVVRTVEITFTDDGRAERQSVSVSNLPSSTSVPDTKVIYDDVTKRAIGTVTLTASGDVTSSVSWGHDSWGRQVSYTDSSGHTTNTAYVAPGQPGAGSVATVTDGHGQSLYTYDGTDANGQTEHRGLLTGLEIDDVGVFTASYDNSGALIKQTLPGGLTETIDYGPFGRAKTVSYSGQIDIEGEAEEGVWFSFSRTHDAAGRVVREWTPESFSEDQGYSKAFTYDRVGRLVGAESSYQTGPDETTCETRSYAYDKNGNRTALTSGESSSGGCIDPSPTTKTYTYDNFSRQLTAENQNGLYQYDAFGRQLAIPGADSSDPTLGNIEITYFDDDSVRTISQDGVTSTYGLDPEGRRVTETSTGSTTGSHFGNASDTPTWVEESVGAATSVVRYYSDIAGGLGAFVTENGGASTSTLALADIGGNTVSTVVLPSSGNAEAIEGYQTFDEFGAQRSSGVDTGPADYGWHGDSSRAKNSTGLVLMGLRVYNPKTGRFTSTDPVSGGGENDYVYPNDPINQSDISGALAQVIVLGVALTLIEFMLLLAMIALAYIALWLLVQMLFQKIGQLISWLNTRSSGKEKKDDVPSWAKGATIKSSDKSIVDAVERTFREAGKPLPPSNKCGGGSEWSKIKKYLTQKWNAMQAKLKALKKQLK
ncbi:MAG: RHS repeat domain-containing protein [Microbacteriaceae bacterium]